MRRFETCILAAILFAAVFGLVACHENNRDEQQNAVSPQQATAQKPAEKPNAEEEEEGEEDEMMDSEDEEF